MRTPSPAGHSTSLTAARRERELSEATDGRVVDLLVVGLGVTGAGVALDAAARGLSVVAVDAHDMAFGTSRWSSKLVHGGLRYLAKGQVGVAYESAVERGILMSSTAPHLVRALPMLLPLTPAVSRGQGLLAGAGLLAGDVLRLSARTARETLPRPRRLGRTETLRLAPGVAAGGLRGGLLSQDGQLVDDARLVIAIARTAAGYGARVVTRCRVLALGGDGAVIQDLATGTAGTIRSRAVVNAAGVWAAGLVPGVILRPSRGTHIVVRSASLRSPGVALTVPVPGEANRYVFSLPQHDGLTYVGLTDEPLGTDVIPDVPEPAEGEVGFLLDVVSSVLAEPLSRADVLGAYAGLRPLLDASGRTADLSRRHTVLTSPDGVVTVVGGKLTTYRRMAQDAVDTVVGQRSLAAGPCRTRRLPLVGAGDTRALRAAGVPARLPARLIDRYGVEAGAVAASPDLLAPVSASIPVTHAELRWGVEHEGALDVDDLLDRRTRIGLVPADRARAIPAALAALRSPDGTGPGATAWGSTGTA